MNPTTKAKDHAQEAMDKTKEAASGATDKLKDAASHAGSAASHAASAVGSAASNAASAVGHKADDAAGAAGRGMQGAADKVRGMAPESGVLHSAAEKVAGGLESAGEYLEDKKLSGMASDLTDLIKRNPIPALLIGIGVGFLLARGFRS